MDAEIMTVSLLVEQSHSHKRTGVCPHGICLDCAPFAVDQASCLSRGIPSSSPKPCIIPAKAQLSNLADELPP